MSSNIDDGLFRRGLPGFWDRVQFAFGKAATGDDAPPLTDKQLPVSAMMRRTDANYTAAVDGKFTDMVRYGWRRNELIFSCISKTAKTASQVELKVYNKRTQKELPDHPLKKLLQAPNPEMTEYDFWSAVITYQKLAGRAIFEKERTRGGEICRLWPLRPDWVERKMRNAVQVEYYRYKPEGGDQYADLAPTDVCVFKVWDPTGLFSSWPPVAVAARSGDVDNDATDLIKSTFQEGGSPPIAIKLQGRVKDEQVTELRARWRQRYGGWRKQIDPAILDSGADITKIGFTFKEMGFGDLDARSEARICMVLDVPPILVGAKIGLDRATYANYGEARLAWWQDSLTPMYADLLDVITNSILPEFPDHDNIMVAWDFGKVNALQEDQNLRWERATKAWDSNAITLNEFRAELGWLPLPPDQGDLRKFELVAPPPTMLPTNELTSEAETEPEDPNKKDDAEEDTPPEEDEESKAGHVHIKRGDPNPARSKAEREMTAKLVEYFVGQQKRIMEAVQNAEPVE